MRVVVPFDTADPKSRLAPVLNPTERQDFAGCMLADVLDVVTTVDTEPTVLATAPLDRDLPAGTVRVDERPLSVAVDAELARGANTEIDTVVVMADLALLSREALDRLVSTEGDVVLAPGRGVGTNALVVRHPDFHVDFHGASYLDHHEAATAAGLSVGTVDSFRLSTDIDEPPDLVEAFVHGAPRTREWLRSRFELDADGGRVGLTRR